MRKINIPSSRDDLAAAIVFTSTLKDAGLEIHSELHVFFAGRTISEKWQVAGEREEKSRAAFTSVEVCKVRLEGDTLVRVEIGMILSTGEPKTQVRTFDFAIEEPSVRVVPHPFSQRLLVRAESWE